MELHFGAFWPILLLLLTPLVMRSWRSSGTGLTPFRLRAVLLCRCGLLLLLALALMQPRLDWPTRRDSIVFLVDASESVSSAELSAGLDWIDSWVRRETPDHFRVALFGDGVRIVSSVEEARRIPVQPGFTPQGPRGLGTVLGRSETALSEAISAGLSALAPRHRQRLILLTDGWGTTADPSLVLNEVRRRDVTLYIVPLAARHPGDSWIQDVSFVETPTHERPGKALVSIDSGNGCAGYVSMSVSDQIVSREEVTVSPGTHVLSLDARLPESGDQLVETVLDCQGDAFPGNNTWRTWVTVRPAPSVLVLAEPGRARTLAALLRPRGFQVDVRSVRSQLTSDLLSQYTHVALLDPPPTQLTDTAQLAIERFVAAGGGLFFSSGTQVTGEELKESALERLLPAFLEAREDIQELALVIVLDKSRSMEGEKIELAKQAALGALELLDPTQFFALVTFDFEPYLTVPLQNVTAREEMQQKIREVEPGAHTNIYPALEQSYFLLSGHPATSKHVILLSDGKTYPDDYEDLLKRLSDAEITVSTVAVGSEADRELLGNIAKWGNGKTYFTEQASRVPQIFLDETRRIQRSFEEAPRTPSLAHPAEFMGGIDDAFPVVSGLVRLRTKPSAEVLIRSEEDEPILLRWQYGTGAVVLFASDLGGQWSEDWLTWPPAGRLFAQLLAQTPTGERSDPSPLCVSRTGRLWTASLESSVLPTTPTLLARSSGQEVSIPLSQAGADKYKAVFELPTRQDDWVFELEGPENTFRLPTAWNYPPEHRFLSPPTERLSSWAQSTGGALIALNDRVPPAKGSILRRWQLEWLLMPLALLLLLAEIGFRRIPWDSAPR